MLRRFTSEWLKALNSVIGSNVRGLSVLLSLTLVCVSLGVPGIAIADGGNCSVKEVATLFNQRVHVKCSNDIEGFVYFAVPMSNSDMANQVLSLATVALTNKVGLVIQFDNKDNSGPAYGCALSSCRPIQGLQLIR